MVRALKRAPHAVGDITFCFFFGGGGPNPKTKNSPRRPGFCSSSFLAPPDPRLSVSPSRLLGGAEILGVLLAQGVLEPQHLRSRQPATDPSRLQRTSKCLGSTGNSTVETATLGCFGVTSSKCSILRNQIIVGSSTGNPDFGGSLASFL